MEHRSSTSSSEAQGIRRKRAGGTFPVAGALAIFAILCVDRLGFGHAFPWSWVSGRVPSIHIAESGQIRDQRGLRTLEVAAPGRPRVAVVGSSRAQAGFHPEWIDRQERPAAAIAEFTRPGLHPFEVRSLVGTIAAREPDVVVLIASEYETHYPLRLRAELTSGSAAAIADLVSLGGFEFAVVQRSKILQLVAASALHSYRTRSVLRSAGVTDVAQFRFDPRLQSSDAGIDAFFEDTERLEIPVDLRSAMVAAIAEHLPEQAAFSAAVEMNQLRGLAPGEHVRIQQGLLRRSAQLLRAAGAEVILLEAPLFPPALALYDASLPEAFERFGRALADESGVRFVPLDAGPPFAPQDFYDLTHLRREGTLKFTRWVFREIDAALARRSASGVSPQRAR